MAEAGELLVMESSLVDGEAREPREGDVLEMPAGTPHLMSGAARVRWETRPALRTAEFFEALFALQMPPAPEDVARLTTDFAAEFRLV